MPSTCKLSVSLEQAFNQLNEQGWHPQPFNLLAPVLVELAPQLLPEQRFHWQQGLRLLWQQAQQGLSLNGCLQLFELLWCWADWPLLVQVGEALAAQQQLDSEHLQQCCIAYQQLGQPEAAQACNQALLLTSGVSPAQQQLDADLQQWCQWRAQQCVVVSPDQQLQLEPLAPHHCEDFFWQFAEPAIAQLCDLPAFREPEPWLEWLDQCYSVGDELLLAIIHPQWGFIGSVSLVIRDGLGFFYYWLGADFQGQRLGPQAVELLLQHASTHYGLHTCYAKAFYYNGPSIRAMARLGFDELALQVAEPYQDERLFRRGPAQPLADTVDEMQAFFRAAVIDVSLVLPETGPD